MKYRILCAVLTITTVLQMSIYADDNNVFQKHVNNSMKIALTFDDGPDPRYTSQILDILNEYNIKATFFLIGENIKEHPDIVLREIREGHELGNHTYNHPKLAKIKPADLIKEINKTENAIYELGEYRTRLFRPPEGSCTKDVKAIAEKLDYTVILWNIDTTDWHYKTPVYKIVNTVLSNVSSGDIILCHDFVAHQSCTVDAIKIFIPKLIDMGYKFVTVSELITSK